MKRITALLLVLFFATSAFAQTNWFKGTFNEAQATAEKEGKLILLNLTSSSF